MRKDLENFVKSCQEEHDLLKIIFLEWPRGLESLIVIKKDYLEEFSNRSYELKKFIPDSSKINIVCYSESEWSWIGRERSDFASIVSEFGSVIYDGSVMGRLRSSLGDIAKNGPHLGRLSGWIDNLLKDTIDKNLIAKAFQTLAQEDLESSEILLDKSYFRQSIFLSSQSVEKYLKSIIASKDKIIDKTHNLKTLFKKAIKNPNENESKFLSDLERMYLNSRYPAYSYSGKLGKPIAVESSDAKKFLDLAKKIKEFSEKSLAT